MCYTQSSALLSSEFLYKSEVFVRTFSLWVSLNYVRDECLFFFFKPPCSVGWKTVSL